VLVAFIFILLSALSGIPILLAGLGRAAPLMAEFGLAGAALLVYAVLRRRLFDFGFASTAP
jgi:hypothetical protein